MIRTKTFVFNPFKVNTYLLINEKNEGILIDGACYTKEEEDYLVTYLSNNQVKLQRHLLTHAHIDHILGAAFISKEYGLLPETHRDSVFFWDSAADFASLFGLDYRKATPSKSYFTDGDTIPFGSTKLKIIHSPGHADGSVCFYLASQKTLFSGDVLFSGSIGRTDLPTGNMKILLQSIRNKLLILDDSTIVFPGHGAATTIGAERKENPWL
ncbi:MAG: MBL fold metallo-hydrolase [Bacteroidales bacterium]|nr:MBL fold metallo-hydrolase [Bacteroidales bacterium]MDD3962713.1 MBL fold metallo-hydrolase [Bacteroidales bacterium]MDY0285654.1 MBL fold metallo-hydrolase [Bacteroidales bacterium]HPE86017.1 MBL fold metallo-hydrolase [Bacteroidales bacterium]